MKSIIKKVAIGMLMALVVSWQSKAMNSDDYKANTLSEYAASGASVSRLSAAVQNSNFAGYIPSEANGGPQQASSPFVKLKLDECSQAFKKISAHLVGSERVGSRLWPDFGKLPL